MSGGIRTLAANLIGGGSGLLRRPHLLKLDQQKNVIDAFDHDGAWRSGCLLRLKAWGHCKETEGKAANVTLKARCGGNLRLVRGQTGTL